ncbi:MAG TPA: arsenate reductase family protein [Verrucomicrobium sp.]|nr:arsenate reductase family protein [Verrucomicrobium sp.]
MLKIYTYAGCSTCKNAVKWLKQHSVAFDEKPIRETPPTVAELKTMLKARGGDLRALFNTAGQDYRAMGMKDRLPGLSEAEALDLLAAHGNLVKRPFALDKTKDVALVGFKEAEWETALC